MGGWTDGQKDINYYLFNSAKRRSGDTKVIWHLFEINVQCGLLLLGKNKLRLEWPRKYLDLGRIK